MFLCSLPLQTHHIPIPSGSERFARLKTNSQHLRLWKALCYFSELFHRSRISQPFPRAAPASAASGGVLPSIPEKPLLAPGFNK